MSVCVLVKEWVAVAFNSMLNDSDPSSVGVGDGDFDVDGDPVTELLSDSSSVGVPELVAEAVGSRVTDMEGGFFVIVDEGL